MRGSLYTIKNVLAANQIRCHSAVASTANNVLKDDKPKHWSEIPGPRIWPVIGTMPAMLLEKEFDKTRLYGFFAKLVKRHGPIIRLVMPGLPNTIFIKRPEDIETMYRVTMDNPIRPGFESIKQVRDNTSGDFFSKKTGILSEQGDEWWRVRAKVQTPLLKPKKISAYLPQVDQVTLEFIDRIVSIRDSNNEVPPNFMIELYKWALEEISLIALSRRLGCLQPNLSDDSVQMNIIKEVNTLFETLNETEMGFKFWKLFRTPTMRKLEKTHDALLKLAVEAINQTEEDFLKRGKTDDPTLMEVFLSTPGLSRSDVVTIMLDMLFAGVDTTSHTVAFALYCLARNPEEQIKIQKEIDTVLGNSEEITAKHLGQLTYTKAAIKEVFRLFPLVTGTARTLSQDAVFSGYLVPKGWQVAAMVQLAGWDEEYFPNADKFIPERWLRHQPHGPIHPYSSLPFSTGTRMCIGRRIAEQELYVIIARIFQRFTVKYDYEDMYPISKLVYAPSHPLKFRFIDRE